MGVVIKYLIDFVDTGLKVSNDLAVASVLGDAEVKVDMRRGSAGTQFELKLFDVPQPKLEQIRTRLGTNQPFHVRVKLGYMDTFSSTQFAEVVDGYFTKIETKVESDKQVTTIKGRERATHTLTEARIDFSVDENATPDSAVRRVLTAAHFESNLSIAGIDAGAVADRRLAGTAIEVLAEITHAAGAELLVSDGQVRIGKPVTREPYARAPLSLNKDLAEFRPFTRSLPEDNTTTLPQPIPAAEATGFRFLITGDPNLRPAHTITADVDMPGYAGATFGVHTLVHSMTIEGGYVCEGIALKPCEGDACRRQQDAIGQPNAQTVADAINRRIRADASTRPMIEVGAVKEYQAGTASTPHRATLYYGQQYLRTETQPSIHVQVQQDEEKLFRNKPVVSPFAWHKCGLVVPVYKGMKAVIGHNLNLRDDAMVTGFTWSETPTIAPPSSQAGDWWLCLPIDFNTANPPTDSTKAANDLIANNGHRTIEAKGLRIVIGASKLGNVGARPAEAADDELLIEHAQAQIKIGSNGEIEMKASSSGVTLKITSSGIEIQ